MKFSWKVVISRMEYIFIIMHGDFAYPSAQSIFTHIKPVCFTYDFGEHLHVSYWLQKYNNLLL